MNHVFARKIFMLSKQTIFIFIAIVFVFSYPIYLFPVLNASGPGWRTNIGRPWQTFIIPILFLLIAILYGIIDRRNSQFSKHIFLAHLFLTIVPPILINYPFAQYFISYYFDNPVGLVRLYKILRWMTYGYFIMEIGWAIALLVKLNQQTKRI